MKSVHISFIFTQKKVRVPWPKRRQDKPVFSHAGIREPNLFSYKISISWNFQLIEWLLLLSRRVMNSEQQAVSC